jgi:hypothetical protein
MQIRFDLKRLINYSDNYFIAFKVIEFNLSDYSLEDLHLLNSIHQLKNLNLSLLY